MGAVGDLFKVLGTLIAVVFVAVALWFLGIYVSGLFAKDLETAGVIKSANELSYEKRCDAEYEKMHAELWVDENHQYVRQNLKCGCQSSSALVNFNQSGEESSLMCDESDGLYKCSRFMRTYYEGGILDTLNTNANKNGHDRVFHGHDIGGVRTLGVAEMGEKNHLKPDLAVSMIANIARKTSGCVGFVIVNNSHGDDSLDILSNPNYVEKDESWYRDVIFGQTSSPRTYERAPKPQDAYYLYMLKSHIPPPEEWKDMPEYAYAASWNAGIYTKVFTPDSCSDPSYTEPPPNTRKTLYFPLGETNKKT